MIKSDKQIYFNQIKGIIDELNYSETFCNITLSVGHETNRKVNLVAKKELFDEFYEWVINGVELPYYVQYKYAKDDTERFKVPLSLR